MNCDVRPLVVSGSAVQLIAMASASSGTRPGGRGRRVSARLQAGSADIEPIAGSANGGRSSWVQGRSRPDGFALWSRYQVKGATGGQVAGGSATAAMASTREILGRICLRSLR